MGRSLQPCAEAYRNVIEVTKTQVYATSSTISTRYEVRGLHRVFCDLHLSRSSRPRALISAALDVSFNPVNAHMIKCVLVDVVLMVDPVSATLSPGCERRHMRLFGKSPGTGTLACVGCYTYCNFVTVLSGSAVM